MSKKQVQLVVVVSKRKVSSFGFNFSFSMKPLPFENLRNSLVKHICHVVEPKPHPRNKKGNYSKVKENVPGTQKNDRNYQDRKFKVEPLGTIGQIIYYTTNT